ncbi:MAG: glycosyltransferase family 39 protein [Anaerolineae bacterium]|nr:glycosyltransferase family 39 protein [Anaerolineae bacterium]
MTAPGARSRDDQVWPLMLLAGITALAFWFRWRYARDVPLFVDEYLHLRAAERILARGIPLLPSGNFYSHGLLVSYLEAAVVALGGRAAWLLRLPVVLISTAAVPLAYWFGRRAFRSAGAGLVAAALLAVAPEAVLWGGRIRMYGPLQFFALAATVLFYLWVVEKKETTAKAIPPRLLFVFAFWAALFSHAEAMLLLPVWGLWALVQRGPRWVLRPANLAAFAAAGAAPLIEILLRRLGPPVQARVAPGVLAPQVRAYLGAGIDWAGVQKVVEPLLLTPPRLPVVVLALGAVAYLAAAAWTRRKPGSAPSIQGQRALAYLLAILIPVLGLLLFAVDPEWKSARYGLMLLPHLFLAAGAVAALIGHTIKRPLGRAWPALASGAAGRMLAAAATTALVLLAVAASWAGAVAATRETVPDYDAAFAYVAAHEEPGDVVITFLCPAAFWNLGRCDYLAIPEDFAGFAMQEGERWVSGWDGVPLLDGGEALRQALRQAPGAWLVVDEGRFARRYPPDFLQVVAEEMELVSMHDEVLVFSNVPLIMP